MNILFKLCEFSLFARVQDESNSLSVARANENRSQPMVANQAGKEMRVQKETHLSAEEA